MEDGVVDLNELFAGRAAQTANTVLKGHIAVFGAQGTGKTAFAASIATIKQYTDAGLIQEVAHTLWLSPHTDRRKPREEREPLTFCLDQINDDSMSFHWGGGYVETKEHGTIPCVTEEVFWKMVNAVERGPRDIIRVVFDDYGCAFCTKGGMKWLSKAMML
jgi:hypothetical protein